MILRFSIFGNRYYFTFKFVGLTCLFIALFSYLGMWQYHRAEEKRHLLQEYAARAKQPIAFEQLFKKSTDSRFHLIQLKGHFDNQHNILLDNKTEQGHVGYEVYTPFLVQGGATKQAVLVDRGWVPADQDRARLPEISTPLKTLSITGVVNTPPSYFSLGAMQENNTQHFPLRVQYIDLKALNSVLGYTLPPYVIWLDTNDTHGFVRHWKVTFMGPEKHIMYTVQWFAFALSLLVIFVVLNCHRVKK